MKYDYLIVGSGLFGSVFAREMQIRGFRCLVIEKRSHLGGNVYTENIEGINVHKYGAHIFHTNDKAIWDYVNSFVKFNNYKHKVFVNHNNKLYSFPINLMTLSQVWNISSPTEAINKLNQVKIISSNPTNLEDWILSQVGEDLYKIFIKEYTFKQWGRDPQYLPASIIKRIPIRTDLNDSYFDDTYQGIPIGGYTRLIEKLLENIEFRLNVDYFKHRNDLDLLANKIIFTGKIDEFYNYKFGNLAYRSIEFKHKLLEIENFQGTSVVNYTQLNIPYTRIIEHKHFEFGKQPKTIITEEYPTEWENSREPYYPINDDKNMKIFKQYKELAERETQIIFGGRLAEYRYYDMHQVIGSALNKIKRELENVG